MIGPNIKDKKSCKNVSRFPRHLILFASENDKIGTGRSRRAFWIDPEGTLHAFFTISKVQNSRFHHKIDLSFFVAASRVEGTKKICFRMLLDASPRCFGGHLRFAPAEADSHVKSSSGPARRPHWEHGSVSKFGYGTPETPRNYCKFGSSTSRSPK